MTILNKIEWNEFIATKFDWKQGEHVALIGPTGAGKTTLALGLLPMREYVCVLGTKPRDNTLDNLAKNGYKKIDKWKAMDPRIYPRRILWPDATKLRESTEKQKAEFRDALDAIYKEGSWCVYIDELWFIIHHLKMEMDVRTYLQQARALDISLMVATQRPAFVPLEVYDQSTHLFFWRDNDERNLRRLSGISFRSAKEVREVIADLPLYDVLYINTRDGVMVRTRAPKAGD